MCFSQYSESDFAMLMLFIGSHYVELDLLIGLLLIAEIVVECHCLPVGCIGYCSNCILTKENIVLAELIGYNGAVVCRQKQSHGSEMHHR